jgi:hypothetical protein
MSQDVRFARVINARPGVVFDEFTSCGFISWVLGWATNYKTSSRVQQQLR